jgi:2-polyprenyl-3-methyl-5-hydroxy-6-metoxy-1,4-benzoquinol methylase
MPSTTQPFEGDSSPAQRRSSPAERRWRAELAAWRIDDDILSAAPESPYRLPPGLFPAGADDPGRRPHVLAREALAPGGTLLDVGCGAGAASLPLAPPAGEVVGVDESAEMLAAFATAPWPRDVAISTHLGRWPDVQADVATADVVVCHHVFYNVADLAAFVTALDAHARRRVVVELTTAHPWVPIGPLWRRFHAQSRPSGPTATLAHDVVAALGIDVTLEYVTGRSRPQLDFAQQVEVMRRRLCLPPSRDAEVAEALRATPLERQHDAAVLWWDVT